MAGAVGDAIALLRDPVGFMTANRDTPATRNQILINYVGVLAAIAFVATLIGDSIYYGFYFGGFAIGYVFLEAIIGLILEVGGVFVVGLVIKMLAPNFKSMSSDVNAMKLSSYLYTPFFIASILRIIPIPLLGDILSFLGLLYGLYILYKGLPILVATPQDQVLTFEIVIVVVAIVIFVIIGAILGAILAVAVGAAFLM